MVHRENEPDGDVDLFPNYFFLVPSPEALGKWETFQADTNHAVVLFAVALISVALFSRPLLNQDANGK